ncbi:MAG TPA: glycosyltransferase family 4 protein [Hymenobacter sp.]|uniref:glycosyltransferase family 4 protein n=1 Tax=Hymenobacter sp. TaxID=1898978 RepID=UPI002D7ECC59|nr:glycosyltransferase family 4 protein [Hymenobacter sp.]HET9503952.1 glycosyltransferase family 4 protein [Hymenobacter sp.]
MNILIAIEDLRTGGAQVFGMRLAQALHQRGHQVHLYSHYAAYVNYPLVRQLAPDVSVLSFEAGLPGLDWLTQKAQSVFRRLGWVFEWREKLVEQHLRRTLERLRVQVINSHMIKSDYVATAAGTAAHPAVPVVITMHGCYEEFLHKATEPEVTLKSRQALREAAGVVYLTAKNLEIFSVPGVRPLADVPHAQIYNGFDGQFSPARQLPSRAQLGIGVADVVFGMVARGIPQKGWQYALDSFEELSQEFPQAHLILVGSSDYLDGLRVATTNPRVHFVGFAPNPIDWVRLFDVGLLPSYFASESLPNCVAEYLFCGAPVVATRIGELPQMLEVPGQGLAGALVEQNGRGLTDPAAFTAALRAYLTSPALLAAHKALAAQCFDKFRMARCVAAYEALFAEVQPAPAAGRA